MIDEKDKRILEVLSTGARLSTKQIAKKTSIPITTVFNRIKAMEKEGVIRRYTCVLDKKKIDKSVSAYIMLKINFDKLTKKMMNEEDLAKRFLNIAGIDSVDTMSGDTDIILRASVKDIEELNELLMKRLRGYDEIENVKTLIILKNFSPGRLF
jgi:Lrp/AsnC family leucine-responsive transcriptional regulator